MVSAFAASAVGWRLRSSEMGYHRVEGGDGSGPLADWVCEFCGDSGTTPDGASTDEVQCPACGEPVTLTNG